MIWADWDSQWGSNFALLRGDSLQGRGDAYVEGFISRVTSSKFGSRAGILIKIAKSEL